MSNFPNTSNYIIRRNATMFENRKSKKWVKAITKKNLGTKTPLDAEKFLHKTDKATMAALKKIPFFDKICNKIISAWNEPYEKIEKMSSCILISEKQCSRIYYMTESICKRFGIDMPTLYLQLDRAPNAYTYGSEKHYIVVTSGLLESMNDDEIYAVLAHECGHIACNHVLYTTVGSILINGGLFGLRVFDKTTLLGDLLSAPLELAFKHWMRCSEFSADRAAIACCDGAAQVVKTMMRLSGGTTAIPDEINEEAFISQAEAYKEMKDESKFNKFLEFIQNSDSAHPLTAVRAYEAREWEKSEEFKALISNK